MPEQRYTVRPVRVIYICDEPDCGQEQVAREGITNAIGSKWWHRCKNGHVGPDFGYGVQYPRLEYVQTEWIGEPMRLSDG